MSHCCRLVLTYSYITKGLLAYVEQYKSHVSPSEVPLQPLELHSAISDPRRLTVHDRNGCSLRYSMVSIWACVCRSRVELGAFDRIWFFQWAKRGEGGQRHLFGRWRHLFGWWHYFSTLWYKVQKKKLSSQTQKNAWDSPSLANLGKIYVTSTIQNLLYGSPR